MRPVVVDLLIFVDPEDFRAEHVDLAIFLEKSSSSQRSIIASLSCCDCASMFFFPSTVPLLRSIHDCLARDNVHLLISSSHPLANQTMQPRIEGRGRKGKGASVAVDMASWRRGEGQTRDFGLCCEERIGKGRQRSLWTSREAEMRTRNQVSRSGGGRSQATWVRRRWDRGSRSADWRLWSRSWNSLARPGNESF